MNIIKCSCCEARINIHGDQSEPVYDECMRYKI